MQECEDGVVAQPKEDALTIFVRRWYPEKWEFGKFQEITIDSKPNIMDECKQHFTKSLYHLQRTAKLEVVYQKYAILILTD